MDFKLIDKNIFEFEDENLINKKLDLYQGTIISFPFKKLSYKSFNFFWYIPNKKSNEINIDNMLEIINNLESNKGSNFIEGVEVKSDGPYKLNFINFQKLKYIKKNITKNNYLDIIYLELFL